MKKVVEQAKVLDKQELAKGVFLLVAESPAVARQCAPGQFVMLRLTSMADPLLRRPISIAGADAKQGTLKLICRVVGHGTELLSTTQPGDTLDIMGPLGSGFELSGRKPLLVGGGIGLAPLLYVAESYCPEPVEVLAGGRSHDELFWVELFKQTCRKVHVSTDDGSMGICGTCADALPDLLKNGGYDMLLTCGPRPMMQRVAAEAAKAGIRTQISLEERMACGLGACRACTCSASDGTARQVCKDGPVFWAEEVDWT